MAVQNYCCCCTNNSTGASIIAGIGIAGSIFMIIGGGLLWTWPEIYAMDEDIVSMGPTAQIMVGAGVFHFITNSFLLLGLIKKIHQMLAAWNVVFGITIILTLIGAIATMNVWEIGSAIGVAAVGFWLILVVYGAAEEIRND